MSKTNYIKPFEKWISTHFPSLRLNFGRGSIERAGSIVRETRIRKALIVSSTAGYDRESTRKLTYFLQGGGVQALNFTIPSMHDIAEVLTEGSDLLQRTGCDGVIGIGGSQVLDVAKLISLIGTNRSSFTSLDEFAEENSEAMRAAEMGLGQSLSALGKDPATLVTVPTGGATGCEITPRALVYEGLERTPLSFSDMSRDFDSRRLVPHACIVDPDLFVESESHVDAIVAMAHFLDVIVNVKDFDEEFDNAYELACHAFQDQDSNAIRCTALLSGLLRTHYGHHGGFMHLLCRAIESRSTTITYSNAMKSVLPVWLSRQKNAESFPFEGSSVLSKDNISLPLPSSNIINSDITEPVASVLYSSMSRFHNVSELDRAQVLECVSAY